MEFLLSLLSKPFAFVARHDLLGRVIGFVFFVSWSVHRIFNFQSFWTPIEKTLWALVTIQYAFFIFAYLFRKKAVAKASGFWETMYPLGCAVLPFALDSYSFKESPVTHPDHAVLCVGLLILGLSIQVLGVYSLRFAFSIMVESRECVASGIYRLMRHPMYVGSIIAAGGMAWFRWSELNGFIFVTFIVCQWYRSTKEEAKLMASFPEYGSYKKRVWWF